MLSIKNLVDENRKEAIKLLCDNFEGCELDFTKYVYDGEEHSKDYILVFFPSIVINTKYGYEDIDVQKVKYDKENDTILFYCVYENGYSEWIEEKECVKHSQNYVYMAINDVCTQLSKTNYQKNKSNN